MKVEEIKEILKKNSINIEEEKRNGNNLATILKLYNGCILNCYDTGKLVYQGKNTNDIQMMIENKKQKCQNNKVFVVYGHDINARTQLEAMLRRWDLEPLIIDQLVSSGQTIIEKLEEHTGQVQFGIVLATPDDIGYAKDDSEHKKHRVRQNVVLELGMLLSAIGRSKVAILLSQAEEMEKPSDIDGLIYIPFNNNVEETKLSLAKEMQSNGYGIELSKL